MKPVIYVFFACAFASGFLFGALAGREHRKNECIPYQAPPATAKLRVA